MLCRSAAGQGTPCMGSGVKAAAWESSCRSAGDPGNPTVSEATGGKGDVTFRSHHAA